MDEKTKSQLIGRLVLVAVALLAGMAGVGSQVVLPLAEAPCECPEVIVEAAGTPAAPVVPAVTIVPAPEAAPAAAPAAPAAAATEAPAAAPVAVPAPK